MRIIIGAGNTEYDGWVSTQENELNVLKLSDWESKFEYSSIDAILAEHVWEHMNLEEGIEAAKNCWKFMKPGGYIRCAVPDANFDDDWYQNMVQVGGPGDKEHPAYGHKIVYDYKTFVKVFQEAGFEVELLEYCDENNKFHFKDWNKKDGYIGRSYRYDTRNSDTKLCMVSIIIDAKKEIQT